MVAAASEAVLVAFEKYDLKRNTRFSTLAMTIIDARLADEYAGHRNNSIVCESRLMRTIRRCPQLAALNASEEDILESIVVETFGEIANPKRKARGLRISGGSEPHKSRQAPCRRRDAGGHCEVIGSRKRRSARTTAQ
jgi:hypothetical protein